MVSRNCRTCRPPRRPREIVRTPEFGAGSSEVRRGDFARRTSSWRETPPPSRRSSILISKRAACSTKPTWSITRPSRCWAMTPPIRCFPTARKSHRPGSVARRTRIHRDRRGRAAEAGALATEEIPRTTSLVLPFSMMQKLHPNSRTSFYSPRPTDAQYVPAVVDEVREYMRRMRKLPSEKTDDFAILTTDTFLDLWKRDFGRNLHRDDGGGFGGAAGGRNRRDEYHARQRDGADARNRRAQGDRRAPQRTS